MLDVNRLSDKGYVYSYIRKVLEETLRWTSLKCDWGSVDIEIPYNLVFSSEHKPWGYRYRLLDRKGNLSLVDITSRDGIDRVIISLISNFCYTKYGNVVDGRDTLYRFVPQAKKVYKR